MSELSGDETATNKILNQQIDDLEDLMIVLHHCADRHIKWSCPYDKTKSDSLKTAFTSVISRANCLDAKALGENGLRSRALNLYDEYYSYSRLHYGPSGMKLVKPPVAKDSLASIQHWPQAEALTCVMMERLVEAGEINAYTNMRSYYDKAAKSFGLDRQLSLASKANRQIM